MGQHRGALGLLAHRYPGQSWADLLQPFTVGARVRKTHQAGEGKVWGDSRCFPNGLFISLHAFGTQLCAPAAGSGCAKIPQVPGVALLQLCPQEPGFAVRKTHPSSPSPSISGRAPSCSAELLGVGLHRYLQRWVGVTAIQELLAMGIVLGAHHARAVLVLCSVVKLQPPASAKDVE